MDITESSQCSKHEEEDQVDGRENTAHCYAFILTLLDLQQTSVRQTLQYESHPSKRSVDAIYWTSRGYYGLAPLKMFPARCPRQFQQMDWQVAKLVAVLH